MLDHPPELSYSHKHVWANLDQKNGVATIGLTPDLVDSLDEFLSLDLPMLGDELDIDARCIHLHLAVGIRHVASALTGRVIEVNKEVLDNPNLLHVTPYANWLYKMEYDEPDEIELLMNAAQYMRYIDGL